MNQARYFHSWQAPFRIAAVLAACIACTISGCQFAPQTAKLKWPWAKDSKSAVPDRVLAVWTDAVMHQPNQPGVRGFGGRIYFYEADESDPIEIDGGLAVYVFDTEAIDDAQKPLKKYIFTAEQFAGHMSHTSIGPSYSVWLPWGEVGGPPRKLSLIARFQGSNGGTVISDPTIKLLPGVADPRTNSQSGRNAQAGNGSHVALAGHQSRSSDRSLHNSSEDQLAEELLKKLEKRGRTVETIDLPPSFQRHLQRANENVIDPSQIQSTGNSAGSKSNQPNDTQQTLDDPSGTLQSQLPSSGQPTEWSASGTRAETSTRKNLYTPRLTGFTGDGRNARSNIHAGQWIEPPRDRR